MGDSIKDVLARSGVLAHVVVPAEIDAMLGALEVVAGPESAAPTVRLTSDLSKSPIPGFDFALSLPDPGVRLPYRLRLEQTSFKFWLKLGDESHVRPVFEFVRGVPGFALTGARKVVGPDGSVSLVARDAGDPLHKPRLVSRSPEAGAELTPSLLVSGDAIRPAAVRFTPDTDSTDGVIALGLEPPTVVFGESGIGFDCPALVFDDSETAAPPGRGAPGLDPPKTAIRADSPGWRGIVARQLDFYLPAALPLFGGRPVRGYLEIPRGPGGVELVVESRVPPDGDRPGYDVRIECLDPTTTGLSGLVPTLISATMTLPLDGARAGFPGDGGQAITFGAGKPVRATATLSRDPVNAPGEVTVVVAVAGQGDDGLLSVRSTVDGTPHGAKIFNTAAAFATALIADRDVAHAATVGDTPGVVLAALLAAGEALSSLFAGKSDLVLHGVELESRGHGAPVGEALVLVLDYSVAVVVRGVSVGSLAVAMDADRPMRVRVRQARMSIDFTRSGLDMIGLDFDRATLEVENPGAWNVAGLQSLFDVLRSRSGRGSTWVEVDLGFKLNLGPVRVSGATIRAELQTSGPHAGTVDVSVRGLAAGIDVPGAIDGTGALRLIQPGGFAADLRARVVPLNLGVDAGIVYAPPMVLLRLSVDLPAPIPLANSGFGLFGLGGLVGISARPDYAATGETDPVLQQLTWNPDDEDGFALARGQTSFGLGAAVGTLPDLGFTFSARAGLLVTTPDLAVRGSLNGRVLQPAAKMSDPALPDPGLGIRFLGFLGVDPDQLTFGVLGTVDLRPLMVVNVPLGGHFPRTGDTTDWYTYLGADGAPFEGRQIGPICARVLPDFVDAGADAYLMVRGRGITDWPYGRRLLSVADGQVVAFGLSLQNTFGVKPLLWAELHASLDLLLGTKPPTLAGFGRAGGSLNLGPFSLGVQAQVKFAVVDRTTYFWAEVTGRIELFFFDVEGTVTISFGDHAPALQLPPPDRHPLDRVERNGDPAGSLATLTDDRYRTLGELAESPAAAPVGWPDAIVSLPFAVAPAINPATAGAQFPGVLGPGATPPAARLGTEMLHYGWRLEGLTLRDVTDEPDPFEGPGVVPPGQLAARWQVPRSGAGGSDVHELLLFSTGPDLWVNRLVDGGAGLPGGDPLRQAADICTLTLHDPAPGWAVGFLAGRHRPGYRLPADPVSANPWVSRVEARMQHFGLDPINLPHAVAMDEVPLDEAKALPPPYTVAPAALVAWPDEMDLGRRFAGHLVAPNLRWLPGAPPRLVQEAGRYIAQEIVLDLTEPTAGGELILVVDPELARTGDGGLVTGFHVLDNNGNAWEIRDEPRIPTGETAFVFVAPTDEPVWSVRVTRPLGAPLGVVGFGAVTCSARDAVVFERTQVKVEVDRRAAAAAGPRLLPDADAPHHRTILAPGRTYRVDVEMTWAGELARQNETGQIEVAQTVAYGDPASLTYAGGRSSTKRLFFKTAPRRTDPPPPHGARDLIFWLMSRHTDFRPEMLERHLAGYEPAQSEEHRFCDDPLRAHFGQDHVVALARAYGYELAVAVRRVDRPGAAYAVPRLLSASWSYVTDPAFLQPVDRIRHDFAVASPCPGPLPGSTATAQRPGLEPHAWYELFVKARGTAAGIVDGELPRVTFGTSRWRDPADMFAGLGFQTPGHPPAAVVQGDLAVPDSSAVSPPVVLDDDQGFENALVALGLEGWPATDEPRLSRLWTAGPSGWLFAGLLVESPEPIHRPGRLRVDGLRGQVVAMGPLTFDVHRRDRLGTRLLYLTRTPRPVLATAAPTVRRPGLSLDHRGAPVLQIPSLLTGAGSVVPVLSLRATSLLGGPAAVTATLPLPAGPSFAGEPR